MKNKIDIIDTLDNIKRDLEALSLFCFKLGIATSEVHVDNVELEFLSKNLEHYAKLIDNISSTLHNNFK